MSEQKASQPQVEKLQGPQNPTDKQVKQWEEQYGDLRHFKVGDAEFYFRKPDRKIYKAAKSAVSRNPKRPDADAWAETILYNCILCNEHLLEDLDYYAVLDQKTDEIVSQYLGE